MRQNHVAGQRLDGEHAVFVDHIALGMIFLRQSGGTGIDVGHTVLFLHGEHVRVAVNQQVARLVRRQVIEVEQMAVGDESRAAIQIKEGVIRHDWELEHHLIDLRVAVAVDAEDPVKLTAKAILFIVLAYYADEIVNIALTIGGTPYAWILSSELPSLDFASFNSVLLTIIGVCANGGVALIVLILTLILAWNYIKLLFEAAERYVLLGVLVYTAPVAFAMGASQSTANIFKSWCRMFGGQIFLLLMNAWCLRLFITMVGTFISNPLSM